jgi:ribonuclease Z
VASRELVILGSSSQVPTRYRNHNGYVLRWDDDVILFDPGEGTQRQLSFAHVSPPSITMICITHFHGDHCLGLPGVLARFGLDRVRHPVDLYFPASGAAYLERLRNAAVMDEWPLLRVHPVDSEGLVAHRRSFALYGARLDHSTDAFGWRVSEPPGRRMLPDRLAALDVRGPAIGVLQRAGELMVDGRRVTLDEVSEPRAGQNFAFVMDTRLCDAALALARDADLFVCESTFLDSERDLAHDYRHLTAKQAAEIARDAGARRLVLTHFSQRYPDDTAFLAEARTIFADVVIARDLLTVGVPRSV